MADHKAEPDDVEQQVHREYEDRRRLGWMFAALAGVLGLLVVGLAFAIVAARSAGSAAEEASMVAMENASRTEKNAQARDDAVAALKAQIAQFEACRGARRNEEGCEEPVVEPKELASPVHPVPVPGPQGPEGRPGRPPTAQEIQQQLVRYCSTHDDCRGERGRPGRPGKDGQPGGDGEPGEPGEDGSDGTDGEDSTVPGPPGPEGSPGPPGPAGSPGEDSTVPGPAGPQGPAGEDGQDGRGITTVTLEGDGFDSCDLVVHYTDDTADRIPVNPIVCQFR